MDVDVALGAEQRDVDHDDVGGGDQDDAGQHDLDQTGDAYDLADRHDSVSPVASGLLRAGPYRQHDGAGQRPR